MKTYSPKMSDVQPRWYVVDAQNAVLGRLASKVAQCLMGKNNPLYSPHRDMGDYVIIINAEKIAVTGNKLKDKTYYRHTGYPGGIKEVKLDVMLAKHPERVLMFAVKRMLPRNRLGRSMLKKLRVYAGSEHPHEAQKVETLALDDVRRETHE